MEPGLEINCVVGSGFQGFGVAPSHMLQVSNEVNKEIYFHHPRVGEGGGQISVDIMLSFI